MRTTHTCPRCQHDRVLLVDEVPELADMNMLRPLSIATAVVGKTFTGKDKLGPVGALSAAVCRKCGYAELYVKDPASIPVDGVRVREVVAKKK